MTAEEEARALVDALGPDALAKAASYTLGNHWLLLWGFLASLIAVLVIVRLRLLERIPVSPARANLRAFVLAAAFALLLALLTLPFDIYRSWWRETAYGRTSQPLGDWLGQGALATAIMGLVAGGLAVGVYALIRRAGRFWWLWSGGLVASAMTGLLLLGPVLIEPLFNAFTSLPTGEVREALEIQAAAAGVPADRIFVYNGSRQSNNFTANVSGLFGSARIAISDVALMGANLDEVRAVTGHEIGHYVLGHVWRSVLLFAGLSLLFFLAVDRLYPRIAPMIGVRAPLSDPAGLPVLFLIVSAVALLAQPLVHAHTRIGEREADRYSLETVNLPDALASALVKTAEYRDPRPSRLQELLFYSHPSVERRVLAAMQWKRANPPAAS
ncbi:MAG: M48 family metalloprotease [Sphingomonadaceae bacterium]